MAVCVSGEFLEMQQKVLQSRLLSVSREITDCRAKTREDLQSLYSRIVSYVMQRSNLGSATDINAVRETTGTAPEHTQLQLHCTQTDEGFSSECECISAVCDTVTPTAILAC